MKKLAVAVAATAPAQARQLNGAISERTNACASKRRLRILRPSSEQTRRRSRLQARRRKHMASTALSIDAESTRQAVRGCHSERGKAGGLTLAGFDAATIDQRADVAEKMIRKLRSGMMPPPNARRPEPALIASFVDTLETKIDAAAALNPNPGWRPFQRLNRAEYQRACTTSSASTSARHRHLPPDTISRGRQRRRRADFSPTLMEVSARDQPDQPPGGRRSRQHDLGHLQDQPHRLADASGRGRADGDARRHVGHPHLPADGE